VRCTQREASQREEGPREDWRAGCSRGGWAEEQKWQVSATAAGTLHGGVGSRDGFRLRGIRRVGLSLRSMGDDRAPIQRQCDTRWRARRGLSDGEGGTHAHLAWPCTCASALADPCTARSSLPSALPFLSSRQAILLLGPRPRVWAPLPRLIPLGSSLPLEPCRAGCSLSCRRRNPAAARRLQEHPPLLLCMSIGIWRLGSL
jgi:hypothetical protein